MSTDKQLQDEFLVLQTLSRESAAMRQRTISYLQFYMSVQIAVGGFLGLISVNIPLELNSSAELAVLYLCGLGLFMGIGGFAYGAIRLFPKRREEGWIAQGLSTVGNTRDIAAWNLLFSDHLHSLEAANHDIRRHLSRIRGLVLIEVIILVIVFLGAFVIFD